MKIKTLSLTEPWATLVSVQAKLIETRSWATPYRGYLAIHAAKGFPAWAQDCCIREPFHSVLKEKTGISVIWARGLPKDDPKRSDFPLGCVIAICELVDVIRITVDNVPPEPERSFGDYTPGRFAWHLKNIQSLIHPIPARGSLSVWEWETPEWFNVQDFMGQGVSK